MALILLLNLLSVATFATSPEAITMSKDKSDPLSVGDSVVITITIPAISEKLASAKVQLNFDKNAFELTATTGAPLPCTGDANWFTGVNIAGANTKGYVGWSDSTQMGSNALDCSSVRILTATFKVKDTASTGDYTFALDTTSTGFFTLDQTDGTTKTKDTSDFVTLPSAVTVSVIQKISADLPISITAPTKDGTPQPTISGTNFTGSITWTPAVTGGKFAADTAYTANVTLTANTGYQFASDVNPTVAGSDRVTVVMNDGSKLKFNAIFPKTNDKDALPVGASVSITGMTKIGQPLTATTSGFPTGAGTLSYKWYRDGDATPISGADSDTYTPNDAADVGKKIKVEVSAANYSGSVTDTTTNTVEKADYAGSAVTAAVTDNAHRWDKKIEITNVIGEQEYAITTGTTEPTEGWRDDGVFTGLTKDTAYTVYTRVRATDTMAASLSKTTSVNTKKAMNLSVFNLTDLSSWVGSQFYDGSAKVPPVQYKSGYTDATVGNFTVKYKDQSSGASVTECKLPGTYEFYIATDNTGSDYAAGEDRAGVFTISRGNLTAANFQVSGLTHDYNGNPKAATVTLKPGVDGVGAITVYYESAAPTTSYPRQTAAPTNAGSYKVSVNVTAGTYYNDVNDLELGTLTINKVNYTGTTTFDETVRSGQATTGKTLTLPTLPAGASYGTITVGGTTALISAQSVTGTTLTYSTNNQLDGTSATITIPVTGATNYNDYSIVVTVTAKDKQMLTIAGVTMNAASYTYGDTVSYNKSGLSVTGVTTPAFDNATLEYIYSGTLTDGTHFTAGTAAPTKAGSYTLTIKVPDSNANYMGEQVINFTIAKEEVTVSGITANSKPYDGGTSATVDASGAIFGGIVSGDTLTITATGTFADADAGENKTVTLTLGSLSGADSANYTLATSGNQTTATAKITAKDVSITGATVNNKDYNGNANATVASVTITGVSGALSMGTDFDVTSATFPDADADTANVDVTINVALKDTAANNYNLTNGMGYVVTSAAKINKAAYSGSAPTKTVNILKNYAGAQTGTLTAADFFTTAPAEAKITAAVPDSTPSNMMSTAGAGTSGDFIYASKTNITAASNENWTITISSKNYTDITATLTFKLVDKADVSAQITFPNGTLTYNGAGQKYEKATTSTTAAGTPVWTYTYAPADATASLDSAGLPKTAGTYTVTAKYEDDAHIGTKNATLTITKATPTGTPDYTKITTSGKTLADANLTVGTITPAGTISWDAGNAQSVAANTAYDWTFRPTDTVNYNNLTGSITPYTVSHSGGGGGGSSHSSRYTITVDKTENGSITVSPKSASKGDTVTITVKPDKGYELDTLKVLDKDGDKVKFTEKKGKYTFTMPASKVTVKGKFVEEAPEQIFADVPVDAYCYEAVKWAASEGITGGIGNNLFAPGLPCTRGQIVTFLWRAAGSPAPKSMSSFTDIAEDAYYAKAVAWAVENGITGGTGDGKFSPDATCTRAQAVTFLYRASGSPAVSGSAAFSDVAADAYYASAVKWAEKNGITGGIGGGLFGSGNDCTRAQIVTFLYRNYQSK